MNLPNLTPFMGPIKCGVCGKLDLTNTLKKISGKYGDRWVCTECAPKTPAPGSDVRSLREIQIIRTRFASLLGDDVELLNQPGGLKLIEKKYGL